MELTRRSLFSLGITGTAAVGLAPLLAHASEGGDGATASAKAAGQAAGSPEAAQELIAALDGTYIELFPVLTQYADYWEEVAATIVGEEDAPATAEKLMDSCMGELHGQEAIDAYTADPDATVFDCFFPDGVKTFTVAGDTISGADEDGAEVFSHAYTYLCYAPEFEFYVFQTADEDAGEYRYFVTRPDTTKDTYHLEFRFGSDLDDLLSFYTGAYAYWLGAAIDEGYDDELAKKAIELFVTENLEGQPS